MQYVILVHVVHSCEQLLHVGLDVRRGQYLLSANSPLHEEHAGNKLQGQGQGKEYTHHVSVGHEAGQVVVHVLEHHERVPHVEATPSLQILCVVFLCRTAGQARALVA